MMSKKALFIRHKAKPGMREEVRKIWEKFLPERIKENGRHEAYFYCFDDNDPDAICVFQLYADDLGSTDFSRHPWFAEYSESVAPLLSGESEFETATPQWIKHCTNGTTIATEIQPHS